MEKNNKTYQLLIMRYLENDLSPAEKTTLESEIKHNADLKKELDFQTRLNSFLKGKLMAEREESELLLAQKETDLNKQGIDINKLAFNWVNEWKGKSDDKIHNKEIVNYITNNTKPFEKHTKGINKNIGKIRALVFALSAAAIIIMALGLIKFFGKTETFDELYAQNYNPYPFVTEQNRGDTATDVMLNIAIELLKAGNTDSSQLLIEQAISKNSRNVKAQFIMASVLMEEGKFNEAAGKFTFIINSFDGYRLESQWYMSLCYLKLNDRDEAKKTLQILASDKNYYQSRAQKLLDKIEEQ